MKRLWWSLPLALLVLVSATANAKIVKTKKAPGAARDIVVGSRIEFETHEFDVPILVEWNPSNKLELSAEYTYGRVELDNGTRVQGFRDLELGAVYEVLPQRRNRPSLALELDVKVPTTKNIELGTGKTDVALGVILSKDYVKWELQAGANYTFVGNPAGVKLSDVYEVSVAGEWHPRERLDVLAEVVASDGGAVGGTGRTGFGLGGTQAALNSSGGFESEVTVGVAEHVTRRFKLEQGVSYTSDGTILYLLGWEYDFGFAD
jgi:hypothetical protein